jgi:hypothetical protein
MLGQTLLDYELYIYSLADHYPFIQNSTLTVIHQASDVATVKGDLAFGDGIRLSVRELVRFDVTPPTIAHYGYEVRRGEEKLYWYDSQPHPGEPELASTHPHHKHVPPDIKRNRVPAPGLSFTEPNLPFLIAEIEQLLQV